MPTKKKSNAKIATNITAAAIKQEVLDTLGPQAVAASIIADNLLNVEEPGRYKVPVGAPKMASIHDLENSSKAKTITVVAKTSTHMDAVTGEIKHYVMEPGRLGAQVGHAVSKLKLSYLMWHAPDVAEVADWLIRNPITSIVLEARDSQELRHIMRLLDKEEVHYAEFFDTNKSVYGQGNVLTAVAIGPVFDWMVDGITDYLYLWKAPDNPVG